MDNQHKEPDDRCDSHSKSQLIDEVIQPAKNTCNDNLPTVNKVNNGNYAVHAIYNCGSKISQRRYKIIGVTDDLEYATKCKEQFEKDNIGNNNIKCDIVKIGEWIPLTDNYEC